MKFNRTSFVARCDKKLTHWQVSSLGPFHLCCSLDTTLVYPPVSVSPQTNKCDIFFSKLDITATHSQHVGKRRWIFWDEKLKKLALSDGIRLCPEKLSRLDIFKFWNAFTTQSIIPFSYITPHLQHWDKLILSCTISIVLLAVSKFHRLTFVLPNKAGKVAEHRICPSLSRTNSDVSSL